MKKAKAAPKGAPKKLNKNNKSTTPASKVAGKVVGKLKSLVKAMSAKPVKKAQTKAPVKAAKPAAKAAVKAAAPAKKTAPVKAAPAKAAPAKAAPAAKSLKTAPVKPSKEPAKAVAPVAVAAKKGGKEVAAPAKAAPVVAAVLSKKKADKKMSAAQAHAEHLERMCRETACENYSTTKGYCRLHYIQNWKKIKRKEMILKEGKLNQYVEELVSKYPDKYIEVIRQDLSTEVNFNKVIHDLELDESIDDLDYDGDSIDSLIGSIRKDGEGFDDDEF